MTFGVLIFPDVEELDFVGPWEMLRAWSRFLKGPEDCLIVAQTRQPVRCANGLSVNPDVSFEEWPDLDFLLVPGGMGTRKEVDNPIIVGFIRQAGEALHGGPVGLHWSLPSASSRTADRT
jgi:transcriptional regulator GlxA family with amidase domain